ncbi:hypothetical protein [Nostoc sp. FACHB-280]|uniref:hypothetical protein n=1 Tax=Nostoc sp. FACHB-280 TaxID=2692839 RepID=UPI00168A51E7|nr:hypothetical protein [Nostoc sp. FACHB-280]MBD2495847.1 hypothetical protein [Nostoc sp. FACHB-280]
MSYIINAELSIEVINETQAKILVKYNLEEEALTPQKYKEEILLIGDDPDTKNDKKIFSFPKRTFQSKAGKFKNDPFEPDIIPSNNPRSSKPYVIDKSLLNEDTGSHTNGQAFKDEIKAQIILTAINSSDAIPETITAFTNTVRRAF